MLLVDTLFGKKSDSVPFWFMRQAGRYLPEYKKIRVGFSDFLSFCYQPEAACEVTLQPITRFDMSAAIIFSDILVIPHGLGVSVVFQESVGPVLVAVDSQRAIEQLSLDRLEDILNPVYQAIKLVRKDMHSSKALIGFCGSPWTLACYMLQGKSSKDFAGARTFALREKRTYQLLIEKLTQAIFLHASRQIEAGVDVIQFFDSWSGVLSEEEFNAYVIQPTKKIVTQLRACYPQIPIIGFPRMCGEKIMNYAKETGVDAVGFDGSISIDYAEKNSKHTVFQGNLDPLVLAEDKNQAEEKTKQLLQTFSNKPYVFNLGHGILPHTPIAHVQAICEMIKNHA